MADALMEVRKDGPALFYVPEELKTHEICLAAVQNYGCALVRVPEKLKTPEICLAAVQNYGCALDHVPEKLKTPEICLAAVKQDGYALRLVPDELKTPEICLAAVQHKGHALIFVPEDKKTSEICLAAVQKIGYALEYVPEDKMTSEVCLAAVQNYGHALQYISVNLKTPELCSAAVQQHGGALLYVPDELKTPELCLLAMQHNGLIIHVPEHKRTPEIAEASIFNGHGSSGVSYFEATTHGCSYTVFDQAEFANEGLLFADKPFGPVYTLAESYKKMTDAEKTYSEADYIQAIRSGSDHNRVFGNMTRNGALLAFEHIQDPYPVGSIQFSIRDVPQHSLTENICLEAVGLYGWAFYYVPDYLKSDALYILAKRTCPQVDDSENSTRVLDREMGKLLGIDIASLPTSEKTYEMCLAGVQKHGMALYWVPEDMRTQEICLAAIRQNSNARMFVPTHQMTYDIYYAIVQQKPEFIQHVPREHQTQEMVLASVKPSKNISDVNSNPIGGFEGGSSYTVFDQAEFANEGLLFADKPFGPV